MARRSEVKKLEDCSPIGEILTLDDIDELNSKDLTKEAFSIGDRNEKDKGSLFEYNYNKNEWWTGRYIGEIKIERTGKPLRVRIEPRFGSTQLYTMVEEVFNIKFSKSDLLKQTENNQDLLLKYVIALMWLNLLAKASRFGIPKNTVSKNYKGVKIKGRLDVRKSIIPLRVEKQVYSVYREKEPQEVIIRILKEAISILNKDYGLAKFSKASSVQYLMDKILSTPSNRKKVTNGEYRKIRYKSIYKDFKPVIDLSWQIIKNRTFGRDHSSDGSSVSFLIDMAELWEMYLRSKLKKKLSPLGWLLKSEDIKAYKGKYFNRTMIPDIVFEKNNKFLVWDAKYKRMCYKDYDYDRADFFQIHTYINYFQTKGKVLMGGLLYPLSKPFIGESKEKNYAAGLFGIESNDVLFHVDGIDHSGFEEVKGGEELESEFFEHRTDEFLDRIEKQVRLIEFKNSVVQVSI